MKFKKMDEALTLYFEQGYTIFSDIISTQGDMRSVILILPNDKIKSTVLILRSFEMSTVREEFSSMLLSKKDVEMMSAYFNS
ncbi:hypothetical protein EEL30_00485 (plasmid) [Brevibacillus laterosporus]|uniref:Uncharacterized protein n=1 Tax=Brevibacillus laterosporus TaxID=1465 RepID=A0A518V1W2_BRELA|nr:hypothetical protein EEL30_00485 [Brevibacillus laterosporus]